MSRTPKRALVVPPGEGFEYEAYWADVDRLEDMQRLVGGFIELVSPRHLQPLHMYCDEEGLLKSPPPPVNVLGTALYGGVTPIVGPVLFMTPTRSGDSGTLTEKSLAMLTEFCKHHGRVLKIVDPPA